MLARTYEMAGIRHHPADDRRGGWQLFARLLLWATRNNGAN